MANRQSLVFKKREIIDDVLTRRRDSWKDQVRKWEGQQNECFAHEENGLSTINCCPNVWTEKIKEDAQALVMCERKKDSEYM